MATEVVADPDTQSWEYPRLAVRKPRKSNVPTWMIVGLTIGMLLTGVVAIGAIVSTMGK